MVLGLGYLRRRVCTTPKVNTWFDDSPIDNPKEVANVELHTEVLRTFATLTVDGGRLGKCFRSNTIVHFYW